MSAILRFLAGGLHQLPLASLLLLFLVAGCATSGPRVGLHERRFDFQKDTFAFANELVWEYGFDKDGQWRSHRREPGPDYSHHCFVLARSAAQFFEHVRFEPSLPAADDEACRELVRQVVDRNLRTECAEDKKIVIPGFPDLRSFSQAYEPLLKAECGGFLQSYFQRGNWRMIFPFSRGHQESTRGNLLRRLEQGCVAVVHVVRFPSLSINHAVVVYDAKPIDTGTMYFAYDPNDPGEPLRLTYHRPTRTFLLDPTHYFHGGRVDVYEVYHRWNY